MINVYVSPRRDSAAARRFFRRALTTAPVAPVEVVTDRTACYLRVLDEVLPQAWHHIEHYANNRIEADHAQLKRRLQPMRGLKTDISASTVIAEHAFIQNIRRGHYELPPKLHRSYVSRLPATSSPKQFDPRPASDSTATAIRQRNKADQAALRFYQATATAQREAFHLLQLRAPHGAPAPRGAGAFGSEKVYGVDRELGTCRAYVNLNSYVRVGRSIKIERVHD